MNYNIILLFLIIFWFSSCDQKEFDEMKLCNEFYQLNKNMNFQNLFGVAIGSNRVNSKYDKSSNQYRLIFKDIGVYDYETKGYLTLPIFSSDASAAEIDSVYRKIDSKVLRLIVGSDSSREDAIGVYEMFVRNIMKSYNEIRTPIWFNYENVIVEGNPSVGAFIIFKLNPNVKVFYLSDSTSLNNYWYNRFNKFKKINNNWYCEIKSD